MEVTLKNLILAGIGTLAFSYEKGTAIIDSLIKKGEITVNQGKELNEELKRKMGREKQVNETGSTLTPESLKEVLLGLNLATREDLDQLKDRISKLENK